MGAPETTVTVVMAVEARGRESELEATQTRLKDQLTNDLSRIAAEAGASEPIVTEEPAMVQVSTPSPTAASTSLSEPSEAVAGDRQQKNRGSKFVAIGLPVILGALACCCCGLVCCWCRRSDRTPQHGENTTTTVAQAGPTLLVQEAPEMAANKLPELRPDGYESRWSQAPAPIMQAQPSPTSPFATADDVTDNETLVFNTGDTVEAHSLLSAADLNDKQGEVIGFQGERITVRFAEVGDKALKPGNLKLVKAWEMAEPRADGGSVSSEVASRDDDVEMGVLIASKPASAFTSSSDVADNVQPLPSLQPSLPAASRSDNVSASGEGDVEMGAHVAPKQASAFVAFASLIRNKSSA